MLRIYVDKLFVNVISMIYFRLYNRKPMKKNESTSIKRAAYIQKTINSRPAGTKVESAVLEIADHLFLSPFTIWKDYSKEIPEPKTAGRNKY